jgi:hypothetical protein
MIIPAMCFSLAEEMLQVGSSAWYGWVGARARPTGARPATPLLNTCNIAQV